MFLKARALIFFLAVSAMSGNAQDCKLKFSVAHTDGKTVQVGLTSDQKKMWDRDGANKFKGMCLDDKAPEFVILGNQGLNGAELAQLSVDRFNDARTTDPRSNGPNGEKSVLRVRCPARPSTSSWTLPKSLIPRSIGGRAIRTFHKARRTHPVKQSAPPTSPPQSPTPSKPSLTP